MSYKVLDYVPLHLRPHIEEIQMREGRWVIADLPGKDGRIRTVDIPVWVKKGIIDVWASSAGLGQAAALHPQGRPGRRGVERLGDLVGRRAGGQADRHRAHLRP